MLVNSEALASLVEGGLLRVAEAVGYFLELLIGYLVHTGDLFQDALSVGNLVGVETIILRQRVFVLLPRAQLIRRR